MSKDNLFKKGIIFNIFKEYKKIKLRRILAREIRILTLCEIKTLSKNKDEIIQHGLLRVYEKRNCANLIKGLFRRLNITFSYKILNELEVEFLLSHSLHGVEIDIYRYLYSYR